MQGVQFRNQSKVLDLGNGAPPPPEENGLSSNISLRLDDVLHVDVRFSHNPCIGVSEQEFRSVTALLIIPILVTMMGTFLVCAQMALGTEEIKIQEMSGKQSAVKRSQSITPQPRSLVRIVSPPLSRSEIGGRARRTPQPHSQRPLLLRSFS